MSKTTPATKFLSDRGIKFSLHAYDYDPNAVRIGLQAADALGLDPAQTFKTLMTLVDDQAVCVVVPSDAEVAMKKLAAAVKGKSAQMMKPDAAERLSGFKVGGISPFGQKKPVPVLIDQTASLYEVVYINAGQRGLLLSIAPDDALRATSANFWDLLS
jgi:Cys-tRNA(Pro)/Cys-tRNA(Cys) deacylase